MSSNYINIPDWGDRHWRAPVATAFDLPTNGNSLGDVRETLDTLYFYVWNGSAWILMTGASGPILSISATSPLSVTGGPAPVLSISKATSITDGYLSSVDWNTFNSKQGALTPGSISTSTTGVTVTNGAASTVGPNVTLDIQTASGSQPGLLSAADWTTFNNKQAALTFPLSVALGGTGTSSGLPPALSNQYFGGGQDGDITISSGTITLTRDVFYHNLTITGGSIITAGYRIFVAGTLNLANAPAGAIKWNGNNGSAAANPSFGSVSGGAGGAQLDPAPYYGTLGGNGEPGTAGGGSAPTGGSSAASAAQLFYGLGGVGGNGGIGGIGAGGSPGTGGTGGTFAAPTSQPTNWKIDFYRGNPTAGNFIVTGGAAGAGGGGGAGINGSVSGGAGSGGGSGGGVVWISANNVVIGGSSVASTVQSLGGNGGSSPNVTMPGGTGGGGGGGGGGYIFFAFGTLSGSSAVGMLDVSGGNGGNSGTNAGPGGVGVGGGGGAGGGITLINLGTGAATYTYGSAGGAPSGVTGGTGNVVRVAI